MKIEDMSQKWTEICEQTAFLNFGAKNLYAKVQGQNINIVDKITSECKDMKKWFDKMIDLLREKLVKDFESELSKFHLKKEHQIDTYIKLKEYEYLKRNIFEMNKDEM